MWRRPPSDNLRDYRHESLQQSSSSFSGPCARTLAGSGISCSVNLPGSGRRDVGPIELSTRLMTTSGLSWSFVSNTDPTSTEFGSESNRFALHSPTEDPIEGAESSWSGEAESSFEKSDCGCRGPAHFLVNPCHVGSLGS